MIPAPATNVTRPRRRLFRRVGLALMALVGIYAAIFAYDDWTARREWLAACAEADRLDPGWRWHDLLARRPALPDERGAAKVVCAAVAKLPPKWPDWASVLRDEDLPSLYPADPNLPPLDADDPDFFSGL